MAIIGLSTTLPTGTINSLITTAYRRAQGNKSPDADELLTAQNDYLPEVIEDISAIKPWRVLNETAVVLGTAYKQTYAVPSPLKRIMSIRYYPLKNTGTAQAGAASSITLSASESISQVDALAHRIFTTGGTGSGQMNRIIAYNTGTKLATVETPWSTTPDNTTTYNIPDTEQWMRGPQFDESFSRLVNATNNSTIQWEQFESQFHIDPVLDETGGAFEIRGQVELVLIDTEDARWVRAIRQWRKALVLGLMLPMFEEGDDDNRGKYQVLYDNAKLLAMINDARMERRGTAPTIRSAGGLPTGRLRRWRW